jgi:CheY-like chemotaxis protein
MSKRPLIWVLDDSATVRMIIEITLSRKGAEVVGYEDPVQLLRAMKQDHCPVPDVIFVDVLLPKMSGYSLIMQLRSQPHLDGVAIIAVPRLDGVLPRLKARLAGANAYLPKPFTSEQLIDMVIVHSPH